MLRVVHIYEPIPMILRLNGANLICPVNAAEWYVKVTPVTKNYLPCEPAMPLLCGPDKVLVSSQKRGNLYFQFNSDGRSGCPAFTGPAAGSMFRLRFDLYRRANPMYPDLLMIHAYSETIVCIVG